MKRKNVQTSKQGRKGGHSSHIERFEIRGVTKEAQLIIDQYLAELEK